MKPDHGTRAGCGGGAYTRFLLAAVTTPPFM
jgi:hypothetical protein